MLAGAPPGFLLGAATSAYQIEGGNRNDWTAWEKGRYPDGAPHVADGTNASRAADSWNLWRSDLAALQLIGANVYRMGIEWSRLEPAEGVWDEAAAARYREMFAALRAAHIAPMVTLYHFTLPTWVAARGGWEWEGRAGGAGRVRRPGGRGVRRSGRLVVHDQRAERAGREELSGGAVAAGRARSAARGAGAGGAHAGARSDGGRAARRATGSTPTVTGTPPAIGIAQNLRIFDPYSANPDRRAGRRRRRRLL